MLHHWAPRVFAQGKRASLEDLREVLRIRNRLEGIIYAELKDPSLFVCLLRADRECQKNCGTLLRLGREETRDLVSDVSPMGSYAWHRVHEWDLTTQFLDPWRSQLGSSVDRHELINAFIKYEQEMGSKEIAESFLDEDGEWRKNLSPKVLKRMSEYLKDIRKMESDV